MAENVVLDTCVIFGLIGYNNAYLSGGKKELDKKIQEDKNVVNDLKNQIFALMSNDYKNKNSNKSLEKFIDEYKDYVNNAISNSERKIGNIKMLVNGNGEKHNIPSQKIEQFKNSIKTLEAYLDEMKNVKTKYMSLKKMYKELNPVLTCGFLYKDYLDGKYNFYVTSDSYAEVLNHTNGFANYDAKIVFELDEIKNVLSNFTLISYDSSKVLENVEKLSNEYRTKLYEDGSSMDQDINSLNTFGDSRIMAEASIVGMNLITLNYKDFITDKSHKEENDRIRQHIKEVNKNNSDIAFDVAPYTPTEYTNENQNIKRPEESVKVNYTSTKSYANKELSL